MPYYVTPEKKQVCLVIHSEALFHSESESIRKIF